jgi:hypothetical protein
MTPELATHPEANPTHYLSQALQQAITEQRNRPPDDRTVAALQHHGIDESQVMPTAAPYYEGLSRLQESDWRDVQASPEPFITLQSRVNRRALEERATDRNMTAMDELGMERASVPAFEAYMQAENQALAQALAPMQSTSIEGLSKAVDDDMFLSHHDLMQRQGPDADPDDLFDRFGHTHEEDARMGLDRVIFADVGRPSAERMGEGQAEVIVVFTPETMQRPGTIITEKDYLDFPAETGREQPEAYVHGLTEPQDFYATVEQRLARIPSGKKATGRGHKLPLSVDAYARGENGNYNAHGIPLFSAYEAKMVKATGDDIERLIFRTQAGHDAFVAQHGDRFRSAVVPDVREALARGEDVFGTRERQGAIMAEYVHKDYEARSAVLAASSEEPVVTYQVVDSSQTVEYNPAWSSLPQYETPEGAAGREQAISKIADNLGKLFGWDDDNPDLPVDNAHAARQELHVAKIVSAGGVQVIERIDAYA